MTRRVLIDFDFLGEVLGLTVDGHPAVATDPSGQTRHFVPGATVSGLPHRSSPVVGESVGDQQMQITLLSPTRQSWNLRRTAPIQLATCRVYWWPEGQVLRADHEIFRGAVRSPDWTLSAGGEDSVTFELVPARRQDDVAFPPALVGDAGRFAGAPDEGRGSAVPVVYGTARGLPLVAVSDVLVNPVRLVVAGHKVHSTSVSVMRGGSLVAVSAVSYATDGLGSAYAYVTVTPAQYAAGSDFYLEEITGHVSGGKIVQGLGDVMEHAFRTYGGASWYELDRPRVEAARARLNRIAVGLFANDRGGDGTLMQFLQSRIAGQFPVSVSAAGGRLGWDAALFPRGEDLTRVAARITMGQDCDSRVGPRDTSADDVLTNIDLTYGFDGYQAESVRPLSFNPENSSDARRAASRWGRSPVHSVDVPDCADEASAYLLLSDIAIRRSRVRHRVEYHGLPDRFYDLPLASVITVVDPDLGWEDEPCVLEAAEPRVDGLVDVVLMTLGGL